MSGDRARAVPILLRIPCHLCKGVDAAQHEDTMDHVRSACLFPGGAVCFAGREVAQALCR